MIEGTTLALFQQGVVATNTDYYQQLQRTLSEARQALAVLSKTLDRHFGSAAPSMAAMAALLEQLLSLSEGQLQQRDMPVLTAPAEAPQPLAAQPDAPGLPAALRYLYPLEWHAEHLRTARAGNIGPEPGPATITSNIQLTGRKFKLLQFPL